MARPSRKPIPLGRPDPPEHHEDLEAVDHADFGPRASFQNVALSDADLTGLEAPELRVVSGRFEDVRFTGATLERATLVDVEFVGCELSGVDFTAAELKRVTFDGCRLTGVVAPELNAEHVAITGAPMTEAWLRASMWDRCELDGCDLTGADFYGARVHGSRLLRCRLDGVQFSTATFNRVALHGSTFTGVLGADVLRHTFIGPDQLIDLAMPLFAALGITVADEDVINDLAHKDVWGRFPD